MTLSQLQKEIEKELNELWNEHDGTHFYKDEFQSFLSSALTRAYEAGQEADSKKMYATGIGVGKEIERENVMNEECRSLINASQYLRCAEKKAFCPTHNPMYKTLYEIAEKNAVLRERDRIWQEAENGKMKGNRCGSICKEVHTSGACVHNCIDSALSAIQDIIKPNI